MQNLKVYFCEPDAKLPTRNNEDLGFDIRSIEKVIIPSGATIKIKTGLCFLMPRWKGIILKTRSSHAEKGLFVQGGVIDASYTGEVKVVIQNSSPFSITLEKGEKVCQGLLVSTPKKGFISNICNLIKDLFIIDQFEAVDYSELLLKRRNSIRKEQGFGSTGK